MIRLITRGRFTHDYAKGLVAAPEDREPAVRKLIESAGGKLINFYFTTGDSDFVSIAEGEDAEVHHRRDAGSRRSRDDFGHINREGLDRPGVQSSRRQGFQGSSGVQSTWQTLKSRRSRAFNAKRPPTEAAYSFLAGSWISGPN